MAIALQSQPAAIFFSIPASMSSQKRQNYGPLKTRNFSTFEELKSEIHADGMKRIHVGPGHMASYSTAVFVCDTCDEDARKALKKCRIYKSFHFSLHGWMNFHAALVEVADGKVTSNASGHHVAKILKKVLYDTRGKRS